MASLRPSKLREGFKELFGLFSKAIGNEPSYDSFLHLRHIADTDEDKRFFSKIRIKAHLNDKEGRHILICSCNDTYYFVTVDIPNASMPSNIVPIDTNLGLFMAIVLELKLKVKNTISTYDIQDKILVPFENPVNPPAYKLENVIDYFPEIEAYRINDVVTNFETTLYKLSTILYCNNTSLLRLNIPQNVLDLYISVVNRNYEHLNYDNIWRSISATEWRYGFIELYRCIEILFNVSLSLKLSGEVSSRLSLNKLYQYSSKSLKDYYHEDIALEYIFTLLTTDTLLKLSKISQLLNYKGYYKLRNSIVHGKRMEYYKTILKKENDWQNTIEFSLLAIDELYSLFDNELNKFDESNLKSNR